MHVIPNKLFAYIITHVKELYLTDNVHLINNLLLF